MKKIILLALALYLFIAPLTYHPDNKTVLHWASFSNGSVWNIYSFQDEHPEIRVPFNYPPIHYYFAKLQYAVGSAAGGPAFTLWLATPNELDAFEPQLMRYMLAVKLVLILGSVAVGIFVYLIMMRISQDENRSKFAACLWLFNPITLYSVILMGQNDVLAIVPFLMGWYFLLGRKWYVSSLLFAISIGVKFYPIVWLIVLLAASAHLSLKKRAIIGIGTLVLVLATLIPFLRSTAFQLNVLQSSINERFFVPQISLGYEEIIYVIPLLLVILFSIILQVSRREDVPRVYRLQLLSVFIANLILLGFSHFHPQWFSWLVPFWAMISTLMLKTQRRLFFTLSGIAFGAWCFIIILFKDLYLNFGIFTPLRGDLIYLPKIIDQLASMGIDLSRAVSLSHTVLAGLAIASFFLLFQKYDFETIKNEKFLNLKKLTVKSTVLLAGLCALLPVFIFASMYVLMQLLPIPHVEQSLGEPIHTIVQPVQTSQLKTPESRGTKRVDLALRNPQLASTQALQLDVFDSKGLLVQTIQFSGRNIGDPTLVRFDFNPILQPNSEYQLRLTAENVTNSPVLLGSQQSNSNSFWMRTYSTAKPNVTSALIDTRHQLLYVLSHLWLWLLAVSSLLFISFRSSRSTVNRIT